MELCIRNGLTLLRSSLTILPAAALTAALFALKESLATVETVAADELTLAIRGVDLPLRWSLGARLL